MVSQRIHIKKGRPFFFLDTRNTTKTHLKYNHIVFVQCEMTFQEIIKIRILPNFRQIFMK